MLLQRVRGATDLLCMNAIPHISPTEPSDQELVDAYAAHAPEGLVIEMTAKQIRRASEAAHALEVRGYTEQAGVWLHEERPALQATA